MTASPPRRAQPKASTTSRRTFAVEEPDIFDIPGVFGPAVPRTGWEAMIKTLVVSARRIIVVLDDDVGAGLHSEIEVLERSGRLSEALLFTEYADTSSTDSDSSHEASRSPDLAADDAMRNG